MPEGDTVFRTAQQLRAALDGRVLSRCDIRVPRFATVDLTGHRVDEVLCRGKHLFIRVGPASIHSHLSMDGSWHTGGFDERCSSARKRPDEINTGGFDERCSPARKRPDAIHTGRTRVLDHKIRIVLESADSRATGVDLGVLEILDRDHDMDVVAHLGPDLLGPDWSPETAASNLLADPDRGLAQALLDQRVMAGIGNVYANELCFVFGLRPDTAVGQLTDPPRVVLRAQKMLWLNRFRANRTTTGDTRRGRQLWVYGRAGLPCRRCGTAIVSDSTGDRISFWCPTCQR